jgi:hypothetical protein
MIKKISMEKVDYRTAGFIMPIENEEAIGYACVNSMMYREENGLDVTGNYFVYLLHPSMGSTHFTLEPTTAKSMPFKKEGGAFWVDKEILQKIVDAIELRTK